MTKKPKDAVPVPMWSYVGACPKCGAPIYEWRVTPGGRPAQRRTCAPPCKFAPDTTTTSIPSVWYPSVPVTITTD